MHTTEVEVAEVTVQVLSSIVIVYREVSVEKSVPVNVIEVPPTTLPYLGDIDCNRAVCVEV